jgi:hypothetical protein
MLGQRSWLVLIAAAAFPLQAFAADTMTTSVNSHMGALAWLTGSYQCTQRTVYNNGKTRNDKATLIFSKLQDGWMTGSVKGQPGLQYYGYDPKKNRYVTLGTSGPGNYGAGYFHITSDKTVTFEFPDALDNDTLASTDYLTITPTANGYKGGSSGPSDRYPGLRYKSTFTCVRQ